MQLSKPPRTKLRETAKNDSRSDQIGKILHCKLIQQGLADEVNLLEEIYEYGRYSHCDMAPDRDQQPVTNYAPVSPLGWDACAAPCATAAEFISRTKQTINKSWMKLPTRKIPRMQLTYNCKPIAEGWNCKRFPNTAAIRAGHPLHKYTVVSYELNPTYRAWSRGVKLPYPNSESFQIVIIKRISNCGNLALENLGFKSLEANTRAPLTAVWIILCFVVERIIKCISQLMDLCTFSYTPFPCQQPCSKHYARLSWNGTWNRLHILPQHTKHCNKYESDLTLGSTHDARLLPPSPQKYWYWIYHIFTAHFTAERRGQLAARLPWYPPAEV